MNHLISVTKSDGTKELFEEEKLAGSLRRSGARAEVVEQVVDEVERGMKDGMTTADIYSRAFSLLHRHHAPAAVKYSIRRGLFDLGPDGFPFERFVARIFQMWGYETMTDQTLLGSCVEHEVDVVAWKGDELAMAEAKFHNELGLKSDLKVALYVKARFDDLAETKFGFGGRDRKLAPGSRWLVTNTKFTDMAIKYGECKGLKLLGWNYPVGKSLHEIVAENGLQPITSLTSLGRDQKRDLIGRGVLVCTDIIGSPDVLRGVGIKDEAAERVLTEAQIVVEQSK